MAIEIWALMPTAMGLAREIVGGMSERIKREGHDKVLRVADIGWHGKVPDVAGDAFVSLAGDPKTLRDLQAGGATVVNVSSRDPRLTHEFPSVLPDNLAAGELAADHLVLQGYRSFATFTTAPFMYALERIAGFNKALAARGFAVEELDLTGAAKPGRDDALIDWIRSREEATGILVTDDAIAGRVIAACHAAEAEIPEDVGLVGVNNDGMLCETCDPPLTSVDLNARAIGQQAVELVMSLLEGHAPPAEPRRVPPVGIMMRASTRAIAVADPVVRLAIEKMLERYDRPYTISTLAEEVGVSKRKLERAFGDALGCGPAEHYRALRLRRVAELLIETDMPLSQVASSTGFASYQHFCNLFRREFGSTPTQYRRQRRA